MLFSPGLRMISGRLGSSFLYPGWKITRARRVTGPGSGDTVRDNRQTRRGHGSLTGQKANRAPSPGQPDVDGGPDSIYCNGWSHSDTSGTGHVDALPVHRSFPRTLELRRRSR